MACSRVGIHPRLTNQTVTQATATATANCRRKRRLSDAWAKLAAPLKVRGCQAIALFSKLSDMPVVESLSAIAPPRPASANVATGGTGQDAASGAGFSWEAGWFGAGATETFNGNLILETWSTATSM